MHLLELGFLFQLSNIGVKYFWRHLVIDRYFNKK